MKVCIVSHSHFDISFIQAKYISESCDIELFALFNEISKKEDFLDISSYPEIGQGFVKESIVEDVLNRNIGNYLKDVSKVFFYVFSRRGIAFPNNYILFLKLALFIKKRNYDVIHIVGQSPFLLLLHVFLARIPRVHNLHESTSHWNKETFKNKFFLQRLAKMNIEIIFNSRNTLKRFIDFTKCDERKCHTIYFGLLEHYRLLAKKVPVEKNSILFLGHIKSYKGVEVLINAIPMVVEKIPDLRVVIAGRWSLPALKEKIVNDPHYTVIDKYLSSAEIAGFLEKTEFVICPYTSASQSAVVTAAYTFAKPVIATEVDGLIEAVDDNRSGLLVPPRDESALANAIVRLLQDKTLYNSMSDYITTLESDERFSWTKNAFYTIEIYKKAINNQLSFSKKLASTRVQ